MKKQIDDLSIEALQGDIADQPEVMAVVNAANAELKTGGGVAGAIHKAAGPGLYEECRLYAPIQPGEAIITGGQNLPNDYVIHCLGPVYGRDKPEGELLANCYRSALDLAEGKRIKSVAFPAISTGAFGYPIKEATEIALRTIIEHIPKLKHLQKIRFVLHSKSDLEVYENNLEEL